MTPRMVSVQGVKTPPNVPNFFISTCFAVESCFQPIVALKFAVYPVRLGWPKPGFSVGRATQFLKLSGLALATGFENTEC